MEELLAIGVVLLCEWETMHLFLSEDRHFEYVLVIGSEKLFFSFGSGVGRVGVYKS